VFIVFNIDCHEKYITPSFNPFLITAKGKIGKKKLLGKGYARSRKLKLFRDTLSWGTIPSKAVLSDSFTWEVLGFHPTELKMVLIMSCNLLYGFRGHFSCGTRRVVPSKQDSSNLPARVANYSAGSDSSCPLTELAI